MAKKQIHIMRTPEEKEKIILESRQNGLSVTYRKYGIDEHVLRKWRKKYNAFGFEGLISKTGKHNNHRHKKPRTKLAALQLENLKLKIEVERLKKGYLVKGVGAKKEYVSIKDANTK